MEGAISANLGRFDSREASGALNTELVDDVFVVRYAGTWSESDGQIENIGTGYDYRASDSQAAHASILWLINVVMELTLRAYYADALASGDAPTGLGIFCRERQTSADIPALVWVFGKAKPTKLESTERVATVLLKRSA
ncbi:hypothetical protein [Halioxenophilus aromaticivorans]|uniref:Uncharacterized protein n=1 Tax=Halioxenophilus aromaticivorans TaxID=1306992 RepID=A0AAV3TZD1_9ALTE